MADSTVALDANSINSLADAIVQRTGSTGTGTGATNVSTSFGGATKAVGGFAEATLSAGANVRGLSNALTDATKNIPILNKITAGFNLSMNYIEDTADVYRTLSKVGAGANGSLFDLRIASAEARLPLEQFAGMVSRNSELLAGFASNIEGSERVIAGIGNALFGDTKLIERFTNLGYSVEEATEMTLKSMAMDRRAAALENRSTAEQVAEAARYAKSLQTISKLTGKQADQLQDEMQAQMADGAVRAKMRMLEKQGITGATEANKQAMEGMAGASAAQKLAMKEILTLGAPVSDAAKNFVAANGAAAELMYEAKAAIESGDPEGAKKASEASLAAAIESGDSMTNLQIATLKSVSDFGATQAEVLEETAAITDQLIIAQKKAGENNAKFADLSTAFVTTLEKLKNNVDMISEGTAPDQEALNASNRINETLVDQGAAAQKHIAENLKTNESLNATLAEIAESGPDVIDFKDAIKETTAVLSGTVGETAKEQISILEQMGKVGAAEQVAKMNNPDTDPETRKQILQNLQQNGILNDQGKLTTDIQTEFKNFANNVSQSAPANQGNNTQVQPGANLGEGDGLGLGVGDALKTIHGITSGIFGRELGGPLPANQLTMVGEGGPELFMSNTAGRIFPNDVTQSLATLGPELGQKFSEISQQLAQEMQTMGAPMSEAAKVAAANMTAPDSASNPDLIKIMQQLVEINRKSMDIQKNHYGQYKTALKGIM